jgi:hypothetical protein
MGRPLFLDKRFATLEVSGNGRARRKIKLFPSCSYSSLKKLPNFRDLPREVSQSCEKNVAVVSQVMRLQQKSPGHKNSKSTAIQQKTAVTESAAEQ